ncbi:MAG: hypothetical protein IJW38_00510 [Clostridia bacterium]|nr:hypothetical protein [Clostridia bacterium]
MALFSSIPSIVILIAIAALNALSGALSGKLSLVFAIISIALHVTIAPIMLFAGCPLSELALVYMLSLFVYLFSCYIARKKGEDRDV